MLRKDQMALYLVCAVMATLFFLLKHYYHF